MLMAMISTFSQVIPVVDWSLTLTGAAIFVAFAYIILTLEDWTCR